MVQYGKVRLDWASIAVLIVFSSVFSTCLEVHGTQPRGPSEAFRSYSSSFVKVVVLIVPSKKLTIKTRLQTENINSVEIHDRDFASSIKRSLCTKESDCMVLVNHHQ
ncbi:hypothetical protein F4604DRAFT_317298 [Suillus subluteus]|nr:hypothetical protein F4604DRAFT_317298 [Suillus subluteus]